MANETFLVAYEGGAKADKVINYAFTRAKEYQADLLLVTVLEWSPYQFLTPEELAERGARRKKDLARAEQEILQPAVAKLQGQGVNVSGKVLIGNVAEQILKAAQDAKASTIYVGRSGKGSESFTQRFFGSVPIALTQITTVPTVIVP